MEEGFDPEKVRQPMYFKDADKGYVKLTKALFAKIMAGAVRV